jgi:hypothetical protein
MPLPETLRKDLAAAQAEALRVGDSPLRADQLANKLAALLIAVNGTEVDEDVKARITAEISDAERVLRRDDDGREAARHLQNALRLGEDRPRQPSPFLDD